MIADILIKKESTSFGKIAFPREKKSSKECLVIRYG